MHKAKVTYANADRNCKFGYDAFLHYSESLEDDDSFWSKLIALGYKCDFPETSDEPGYFQHVTIFGRFHENKAEFMKKLRKDVRECLKK